MRFVLALLLLSLGAAAAAGSPVDVALHERNVVADRYFRLGDIAEVNAQGAAEARALAALRIGRSPRVGAALTLGASDVERVVLRLQPALKTRLRVSGARFAVVRRGPVQVVQRDRMREVAADALRAFLAERSDRFAIEPEDEVAAGAAVPAGYVELKARVPSTATIPAQANVWIDLFVDGAHYASMPVPFSVRAYRRVLVALGPLAAGQVLQANDFSIREEQVAGYVDAPVPAQSDVRALRLKRPLAAGDVLTWHHAQQAPAVSRDQEIVVHLAVGAIALEAPAVATRDAHPGEIVPVRSSASRQRYPARVTGAGTAEALWRR